MAARSRQKRQTRCGKFSFTDNNSISQKNVFKNLYLPPLTCTFWFLTCSTTPFLSLLLLLFAFQTRQRYWTYVWLVFHEDWFHFEKSYVIFICSAVVLRMNNFLFYGAVHMWIPEGQELSNHFFKNYTYSSSVLDKSCSPNFSM